MRYLTLLLISAATLAACIACSASTKTVAGPTVTQTATTTTTTTATATVTASPSAVPQSSAGLKLGATYVIPGDGTRVAVLAYRHNSAGGGQSAGAIYDSIEVKVCVAHAVSVSAAPWSLVGANDSTSGTTVTGGGLQEPQYIDDNPLKAGECARGWITFDVAKSERIVAAKYAPSNASGDRLPTAKWRLV